MVDIAIPSDTEIRTYEAILFVFDDVEDANIWRDLRELSACGVLLVGAWRGPAGELPEGLGSGGWPGGLFAVADGRVGEITGIGASSTVSEPEGSPDLPEALVALADRAGIGSSLVVVVGNGPWSQYDLGPVVRVPGGVHSLEALVREQLQRRQERAVPSIDPDPEWVIRFGAEAPERRRVRETLCTVGDGVVGTRGSAEEESGGSDPLVLVAGFYDDADPPSLQPLPRWTRLDLQEADHRSDWLLDLRNGILTRNATNADGARFRTLRFASRARPGCVVLRADLPAGSGVGSPLVDEGSGDPISPPQAVRSSRGAVVVAAGSDRVVAAGDRIHLERIVTYLPVHGEMNPAEAAIHLAALAGAGSDMLLAEQRHRWAGIWRDARIDIEGDPEAELALRFGLYHLIGSAPDFGEAAVGARGLTGRAYQGHVFWDADVFVMPVLCAVVPGSARAMLEYRIRRLPAARRRAARSGCQGASFPWESADDGEDVTPRSWTDPEGHRLVIRTGLREEHITADVAWAALHYAQWCDDRSFLEGPGRDLVLDTARYWASRIHETKDRRFHLYGVIGPDEYHEVVDDNAFTNVMARANLEWAARLADRLGSVVATEETERWRRIADSLVDGFRPATGLYEQFAGFFDLESPTAEEIGRRPIAADLLLGRQGVRATQIVKQPDVLMLHHLVPDRVVPGSLVPNLDYYLPRTSHGSSLSPAICASLLARAGRPDEALAWFRLASRLDLDDLTGTTAGGIHLAAMGGTWQALTFGFLGVSVKDHALLVDPRLPLAWSQVTQRLRVLGRRVIIRAGHEELEIEAESPVPIVCGGARRVAMHARFVRRHEGWEECS